ncbi:hypothetical protein cand_009560 [Cryptosporidium andersoni]|uniref:SUN domain-containing protein n=1 Tax=Cryptosporidium andersoni TaxID=117008 RepID=A0A1J4MVC6_9CRYT|nr:hypothetical protein cand_009560 [Cryptosporidium andersoni]
MGICKLLLLVFLIVSNFSIKCKCTDLEYSCNEIYREESILYTNNSCPVSTSIRSNLLNTSGYTASNNIRSTVLDSNGYFKPTVEEENNLMEDMKWKLGNYTICNTEVYNANIIDYLKKQIHNKDKIYFTNLSPYSCRVSFLKKYNKMMISKRTLIIFQSYQRFVHLLDILSSRRPCPFCNGCKDIHLNKLPSWIPPILHKQLRSLNESLDYKLCYTLKNNPKIYSEILAILNNLKKLNSNIGNTSDIPMELQNILEDKTNLRLDEFPLIYFGDILNLFYEELRNNAVQSSVCRPFQYLYKCSWHPDYESKEILSNLRSVTKFMTICLDPSSKNRRLSSINTNDLNSTTVENIYISGNKIVPNDPIMFSTVNPIISISSNHTTLSDRNSGSSVTSINNQSNIFKLNRNILKYPKDSEIKTSFPPSCEPPFFDNLIIPKLTKFSGDKSNNYHSHHHDKTNYNLCGFNNQKESKLLSSEKDAVIIDTALANRNVIQGTSYLPQLAALHYDYASSASNSRLLDWSSDITHPKSIQSSDPDSYLLVPCYKPMWFIIGFPEDILVEYIALFSQEYFSSSYQDLEVLVSLVYPTKQWQSLGILRRDSKLSKEMFDIKPLCIRDNADVKYQYNKDINISNSNPCWIRYMQIRALSFYKEEGHYYCHLSRLQVFGNNVLSRLEAEINGERSNSIPLSGVESVKDVENRLRKYDINNFDHTANSEVFESTKSIVNFNSMKNDSNITKIKLRNWIPTNLEDSIVSYRDKILGSHEVSSPLLYKITTADHPLLSFVNRVKYLEEKMSDLKLYIDTVYLNLNTSIYRIDKSLIEIQKSIKYFEDTINSELNTTNMGNMDILFIKQPLFTLSKIVKFIFYEDEEHNIRSLLDIISTKIVYITSYIFSTFNIIKVNSNLISLIIAIIFILQIYILQQLITLKKKLQNTLQFIKSYSLARTSHNFYDHLPLPTACKLQSNPEKLPDMSHMTHGYNIIDSDPKISGVFLQNLKYDSLTKDSRTCNNKSQDKTSPNNNKGSLKSGD